MKPISIIVLAVSIITFMTVSSSSEAGWLIYHKPEFKGKVIDSETKEPIEGAIIVAEYLKYPLIGGPGGRSSTILSVRETVTRKDGSFQIPSYTAFIPFAVSDRVEFIVYKSGYASIEYGHLEQMLSGTAGGDYKYSWVGNRGINIMEHADGTIELPRVKTREERLHAIVGGPTGYGRRQLPLLYEALHKEEISLGIGRQ